jgi:2',3'-cyclic-nucleotide 2'-phosphodiesterase/3'-nucleotidase
MFENAFDSIRGIVKDLRDKVDLIIVAYHGGFERDLRTGQPYVVDTGENLGYKIIKNISGIDCFISAHQHRYISEVINGVAVIQGGSRADSLGVIDIDFIFKDSWKVINKSTELIKTVNYKEDELIVKLLKKIEKDCQKFLDKKIGNVVLNNLVVKDMFKARLNKHPIVTFINQVQLESSGAMISATSLPNEVTGFPKSITVRNVLSTYVYANTLSVLEISGRILRQILEKNAEYFICDKGKIAINPKFSYPKVQHYNYDMFDGIDYTIDITEPFGERIKSLTYQDKDVFDDQIFSLVVNNYRASGGGDFDEYKNLKVIRQIPFDIAELIIDYIVKYKDLHIINKKNIKIKSENC